jgi:DNA invertase Pin-like site-specific DNA recombinase
MEAFRFRAAQHGDWDLINVYADEGLSGTSMKHRVKFLEMIEDCKAGKIDYILTKSVSRFARTRSMLLRLCGSCRATVYSFSSTRRESTQRTPCRKWF